jgi:hypothetical protein
MALESERYKATKILKFVYFSAGSRAPSKEGPQEGGPFGVGRNELKKRL